MKKILLVAISLLSLQMAYAQLKGATICPTFTIDILGGKINELKPNSTFTEIKSLFPCFTSAEDESSTAKCGGNIFYKDKDIYFYTARDYVEIGEKFKGKLSLPLMGAARTGLFKWLGHPKIKDATWDAFDVQYGTLVLYYNKNSKVNKIQFSTIRSEALKLCE